MYCFGAPPQRRISMKYDAIIVGSGQAGNPLAHRLADLGWYVALIEEKELGGTCINVGCTPTKTMVHRAQVAHYTRNAARWGINASNVSVDLAKIVSQKRRSRPQFPQWSTTTGGKAPQPSPLSRPRAFYLSASASGRRGFARKRKIFHRHRRPPEYPIDFRPR